MTVYWSMNNRVSDFTDTWGGLLQHSPPATLLSDVTLDGKPWIKSDIVNPAIPYTGSDVTRAQAFRWAAGGKRFDDKPDAYFGVLLYVPIGFTVPTRTGINDWALIFQTKGQGGQDNKIGITVKRSGEFMVGWSSSATGASVILAQVPGVYGRPFTAIFHNTHTMLEAWLDGEYLGSLSGNFNPLSFGSSYPGWLWSCGVYQNVGSTAKHILFRNGVAASSLEEVESLLGDPEPPATEDVTLQCALPISFTVDGATYTSGTILRVPRGSVLSVSVPAEVQS